MPEGDNPLRQLPQVQRLLEMPAAVSLCDEFGRVSVTTALRSTLAGLREQFGSGRLPVLPDADIVLLAAGELLAVRARPGLRRAINATGIVLHTNLGRAPLAQEAIAAVAEVAAAYCNLEFDLASGHRGSRTQALEPLLRELTSAEAALAVNNGAAAILLALSALAEGGEVIVSRGELVEIGGGFRVPDVIRQGGARLVEVGSTNKTRLKDYRDAITPQTRVLLKVHQSNFRTIGFTAETNIEELAELAREHRLLVVADLGSGLLHKARGTTEPSLGEALAAGADLVTCSGDKLLGGPQAGLILGSKAAVDPLRRHPLLRAVRLDKMSLAALEATLMLHRDTPERVPVLRMLGQTEAVLQQRAERLQALLGNGTVEPTQAFAGGGSLPEESIASRALALEPPCGAEAAAAQLRAGLPAVIGRIKDGRLLLDMLTVGDEELADLATALKAALSSP
ncbi:MAG: L-seryl-tRNA(Sec) selenium transferase [Hydrocarboniphaga sp.]|uniref:L-seryl-tRNA(Sec) selenium transferase n=1 Tax=Hydrocarboniphaga sp. TaxID=2033016 RepID=UPI002621233C|nr:L-seryl-tRNA(Sec) selenium transferase [Hydrocarboniphaga sp.]MDB5970386.1 L-seryl-tRNA(Sec) selenium transferase [Hydrocarboniphaga sp.]